MKLYLVQHGEARSKAEDPQRPLTERGREDVARVAAFAATAGCQVGQIRHSGKRRAEETASILAEHLSPTEGAVVISELAPRDIVRPMAEALQDETKTKAEPVMLVGHLPFLDRLASLLVTGDPDHSIVRFQMGGIVCLVREEKNWTIGWIVTPNLISRNSR